MSKQTGTVKTYDETKGYGFITPADEHGGGEIYVHFTSIKKRGSRNLQAGDKVEFEEKVSPKARRASNVVVLEKAGTQIQSGEGHSMELEM